MNPRPFSIGGYAGGSMPMGDFKNRSDVGWHAGAFGSMTVAGSLSVRLDGAYSDFGNKVFTFGDTVITAGTKIFHTTVDAQYDLGTQSELEAGGGSIPYISAGVGFYRFSYEDSCSGTTGCSNFVLGNVTETRLGFNVGAGAIFFLSGFTPFVDIHYHTTSPKAGEVRFNMFLASFGLKF